MNKSSFALERADHELGGTGLLTCGLPLPTAPSHPLRAVALCSRKTAAYSCRAVAAFHRSSRASRQRTTYFLTATTFRNQLLRSANNPPGKWNPRYRESNSRRIERKTWAVSEINKQAQ